MYVALSGGTLLISVMSVLYTNLYTFLIFIKTCLPFSVMIRYVRAEMNVHAFMNELDQKD